MLYIAVSILVFFIRFDLNLVEAVQLWKSLKGILEYPLNSSGEKEPQKRMKLEQLASHQVEIENYSFRNVVHSSKYLIITTLE
jgi:hypothetical protein